MQTVLDREDLVFNPPQLGCVLCLAGLPGGASRIYDRSPYGNVGAITGATWVRLPSGLWCLSFDGNDDYVDCGDIDVETDQLTLECWFRSDDVDYVGTATVGGNKGDKWGMYIRGDQANDPLRFLVTTTSGGVGLQTESYSKAVWQYVVMRYNGANITIFVNAVEVTTPSAQTGTVSTDDNTVGIGGDTRILPNRYFNGLIALSRIYSRALSALEIETHFNREKHLFGVW